MKINNNQSKLIKVRVYSAYSESSRPWYVHKEQMTKKQYNKEIRNWKVKEFKDQDSWRTKTDETYSWKKGFINKLHD